MLDGYLVFILRLFTSTIIYNLLFTINYLKSFDYQITIEFEFEKVIDMAYLYDYLHYYLDEFYRSNSELCSELYCTLRISCGRTISQKALRYQNKMIFIGQLYMMTNFKLLLPDTFKDYNMHRNL